MVKAHSQEIPSEYYNEYRAFLTKTRFTGFTYYIDDYSYGYVGIIQTKPRGADPGRDDFVARKFSRILDIYALQPEVGGVQPPDTGPCSIEYWKATKPPPLKTFFTHFVQQTEPYVKKNWKPPWGIFPILLIADTLNDRALRYDVNTERMRHTTKFPPKIDIPLSQPCSVYCDETRTYIADTEGKRLVILDRFSFTPIATILTYEGGYGSFLKPTDVKTDNLFIYVLDQDLHSIITFFKKDFKFLKQVDVRIPSDTEDPKPYSLALDITAIYVTIENFHQVRIFSRITQEYGQSFGTYGTDPDQFNTPKQIQLDTFFLYVADSLNHRISQIVKSNFFPFRTLGLNEPYYFPFNTPRGVALSGDYLIVADTLNHRIAKFLKFSLTSKSMFGILGSELNQFNTPQGLSGDLEQYWD